MPADMSCGYHALSTLLFGDAAAADALRAVVASELATNVGLQAQLDARGASDGDATRHLNVGTMLDTPALFAVAAAFGCVVAVVSDTADAPTLDDFAVGGVAARAPPRVDVVNPFALAGARVTLRCGAPPPTLMLSLQFKRQHYRALVPYAALPPSGVRLGPRTIAAGLAWAGWVTAHDHAAAVLDGGAAAFPPVLRRVAALTQQPCMVCSEIPHCAGEAPARWLALRPEVVGSAAEVVAATGQATHASSDVWWLLCSDCILISTALRASIHGAVQRAGPGRVAEALTNWYMTAFHQLNLQLATFATDAGLGAQLQPLGLLDGLPREMTRVMFARLCDVAARMCKPLQHQLAAVAQHVRGGVGGGFVPIGGIHL